MKENFNSKNSQLLSILFCMISTYIYNSHKHITKQLVFEQSWLKLKYPRRSFLREKKQKKNTTFSSILKSSIFSKS